MTLSRSQDKTLTSIDCTGARTLTAADSGKTVFLNAATGAVVTLPAPLAGLHFRFVTALGFTTSSWDITAATADTIEGSLLVAGLIVTVDAADSIDFVESAENLGDWVEMVSDGTSWFVWGNALTSGGIVATG